MLDKPSKMEPVKELLDNFLQGIMGKCVQAYRGGQSKQSGYQMVILAF